ncbi:MAG: response regulator transcription factor [Actinobacteria bacterium]|nr:response regulator transcription factor [Actinomycetota bacterium]
MADEGRPAPSAHHLRRRARPVSAPISVLVVDDDLFVRETLTDYLRDADDLTLAGTYPDAESALPAVGEHRPDVVLMDVRLPGMSGIEATREVARRSAGTRVLALTSFGDADVVVQMRGAQRAGRRPAGHAAGVGHGPAGRRRAGALRARASGPPRP